jgi:ribonuclease-3
MLNKIEEILGYKFSNIQLLDLALTHKSFDKAKNNERLEFLGDAVLNLIISEHLSNIYPDETEGSLTRMRSLIVKGESLTSVFLNLGIKEFIKLSKGTSNIEHDKKLSIYEDCMESLIAAIYLDSDYKTTRDYVVTIFDSELKSIDKSAPNKDSKSLLQEFMQKKEMDLPEYQSQEDGIGAFQSIIHLNKKRFVGYGSSKKEAEQNAAKKTLSYLSNNDE